MDAAVAAMSRSTCTVSPGTEPGTSWAIGRRRGSLARAGTAGAVAALALAACHPLSAGLVHWANTHC